MTQPQDRDPYASPAPAATSAPMPPTGPSTPPYGAPGYGYPVPRRNGMGTAALVLGIIGLVLCWTVFLGVILGVLALIFGVIGRRRARRGEATNGGAALAGSITGAIAIVGAIIVIVVGVAFYQHHKTAFNNYGDCLNHATTQQDRQSCANEFRQQLTNP